MKKLYALTLIFLVSCASSEKSVVDSSQSETGGELKISQDNLSALGHCLNGDIAKGLQELRTNVDGQKKSPGYWSQVGHCYYLKNDDLKAKYFYKLSLSLDKTDSQALLGTSLLQLKNKDYTEALKSLTFVTKTYPNQIDAKFNLAQLYFYFADYDYSLALIEQVFATGSNQQDGLVLKMKNLVYKAQYQDALKLCQSIESKFGLSAEVANYKSYIYFKQGKFEEARSLLVGGRTFAQEKNIGKRDVQLSFRDQLSSLVMRSLTKKGVE